VDKSGAGKELHTHSVDNQFSLPEMEAQQLTGRRPSADVASLSSMIAIYHIAVILSLAYCHAGKPTGQAELLLKTNP
jgi:hypothetical protein